MQEYLKLVEMMKEDDDEFVVFLDQIEETAKEDLTDAQHNLNSESIKEATAAIAAVQTIRDYLNGIYEESIR